jgi:glycosyltransferase involved in cell wall biosynthesis
MNAGSVSVVIPTFNRREFVCEAIDSVLAQTIRPAQVLIIDDGSEDGTEEALHRYGSAISYHRQQNRGVSAARNLGLSLATGDYVALLDSDDKWHRHKLETQLAIMRRLPQLSLLFTEFEILTLEGRVLSFGSRRWLTTADDFSELYDRSATLGELGISVPHVAPETELFYGQVYGKMLTESFGLTSTALFRRSALATSVRFTEGVSLHEDREFFARMAKGHEVAFVDCATVTNRGHRGSERLTLASTLAKAQSYVDLIDRVWRSDPDFVSEHGPELRDAEIHALLRLAREGVLARHREVTRRALKRLRSVAPHLSAYQAGLYGACSDMPGGSYVLRFLLRVKTAYSIVRGSRRRGYSLRPERFEAVRRRERSSGRSRA